VISYTLFILFLIHENDTIFTNKHSDSTQHFTTVAVQMFSLRNRFVGRGLCFGSQFSPR